jgi:hypothetical protein
MGGAVRKRRPEVHGTSEVYGARRILIGLGTTQKTAGRKIADQKTAELRSALPNRRSPLADQECAIISRSINFKYTSGNRCRSATDTCSSTL